MNKALTLARSARKRETRFRGIFLKTAVRRSTGSLLHVRDYAVTTQDSLSR